jgi:hypothetical protein
LSLVQDPSPQQPVDGIVGHDVDRAAEQRFQFGHQGGQVEEAAAGGKISPRWSSSSSGIMALWPHRTRMTRIAKGS